MKEKTMLKKIVAAAALAFCLVATGTAMAEQPTYVNGIDPNYPPFAYVGEDGKPAGFDVDSMNWIADKMGFKVTHMPIEWSSIIPSLNAKKIDMICSGMSITEERSQQVAFSEPYFVMERVFVVRDDSKLTEKDIYNGEVRLGMQNGTSEAVWLVENAEKNGWNFVPSFYDTCPMAIKDLVNGRIQAAAMDEAPAKDAITSGNPVRILTRFDYPTKFGVALRKGDDALLKTINEGYKLLKADPYWHELMKKYPDVGGE